MNTITIFISVINSDFVYKSCIPSCEWYILFIYIEIWDLENFTISGQIRLTLISVDRKVNFIVL